MSAVTDTGSEPYCSGDTRNGVDTRRSDGVTDSRPAGYPSGPRAVTCAKCGQDIPADTNMLIKPRLNQSAEPFCIPCMDELIKQCRPYYCHHVPWEGSGARDHRTRGEYQHWCDRCSRAFLGALARRYCSDECGELTRAGRRDRRTDVLPRPCSTCHELFTPPRSDGRYCSPACRQRAYRRRKNGGAE